jgi:hypothetical protein
VIAIGRYRLSPSDAVVYMRAAKQRGIPLAEYLDHVHQQIAGRRWLAQAAMAKRNTFVVWRAS